MTKICKICGQEKDKKYFYSMRNGNKLPVCSQCLCKDVDVHNPFTFLNILQWVDAPYLKDVWDSTVKVKEERLGKIHIKENPQCVMGTYLAKMRLKSFNLKRWKDSDHL